MRQKTGFVKVFGDSPRVLVIDFLLDNFDLDFHKSDMAEITGVSRMTIDKYFPELIKNELIIKSRKIGRAKMYLVNKKNPLIRKLSELDYFLITGKELPIKVREKEKKIISTSTTSGLDHAAE